MLYRTAESGLRALACQSFSSNERTRNSERVKNQYTYRVLIVTAGAFTYEDEKDRVRMTAGDALFLPPDTPYRILNTDGDFSVENLWFSFRSRLPSPASAGVTVFGDRFRQEYAEEKPVFSDVPALNGRIVLKNAPSLLPLVSILCEEICREHERSAETERHLLLCILDRFIRANREKPNERTAGIIRYIGEHAASPLTEKALAETFGYSPAHINRLVRGATGLSFRRYLMSVRVGLARQLFTETDLTRSEIAQLLGFFDLSHMNKTLRLFPL